MCLIFGIHASLAVSEINLWTLNYYFIIKLLTLRKWNGSYKSYGMSYCDLLSFAAVQKIFIILIAICSNYFKQDYNFSASLSLNIPLLLNSSNIFRPSFTNSKVLNIWEQFNRTEMYSVLISIQQFPTICRHSFVKFLHLL